MAGHDADYKLQPGIYQIFNFVGGTAMDLSASDRRSLQGFTAHDGPNQKWELSPLGNGYSIRSLYTGGYLTIEDGMRNGVSIVANYYPVSWALEPHDIEEGIWRISWPNTRYLFDLANTGDSKPGTLIQLWEQSHFQLCRLWRFVPQRPTPGPTPDSRTASNVFDQSASPVSSTADTVVKVENMKLGGIGETMITTTTTTVTTTVTRVVKLDCP